MNTSPFTRGGLYSQNGLTMETIISIFILIAFLLMFYLKQAKPQNRPNQQGRTTKSHSVLVAQSINILGVMAQRDYSTHHLLSNNNHVINFPGIAKGYYSDTAYVVVDRDGNITQYPSEVSAQSAYQKGDYGIAAITMSRGDVQIRDIKPDAIDAANMFRLVFGMVLGAK